MLKSVLHTAPAIAKLAWRRWFFDRQADFWAGELGWPRGESQAHVVDVVAETADTKTFVLDPGRGWPGHRAGQYVPVEVEIDGVRARRCYSISSGASAAGARRIAITVRRVAGGRVSPWLHAHLRPGSVVRLGAPAGDFLAPSAPMPLLLVGGGSGITPIVAIVRELAAHQLLRDVIVVHGARSAAHAIFWPELTALETAHPGLRLIARRDDRHGYLDPAALRALVPDLARRETFVCGPPGLIDVVTAAAPADRVHCERFVAAPRPPTLASTVTVQLASRAVIARGPGSLLDQLERAGARPAHGCRMGVCNTCRCTKRSGAVLDLVTGAVCAEPDQEIRLCTSVARSDLTLELG
jgi:ferredoxin-NADP reductase